jgi:gliding motility-associated-like protein
MRLAALFILLSLCRIEMFAQYTSQPQGTFTVTEVKGCAPFTVTIDAPTCTGNTGCSVDYEGNTNFIGLDQTNPATYSHTYTTPGIYTLKLLRGVQIDNLQIQVFDNIPPKIEVLNCGGDRVSINIVDKNYFQYVIDYNDNTPDVTVSPNTKPQYSYGSAGQKTVTVRGLKQNAADNCVSNNEPVTVLDALSAPTITKLEVINNTSIALSFNTSPNVLYKLEVGVNNGTVFQQIKALYNDTADTVVNLKTEDNFYCFRLGAYDPCNNLNYYSTTICSSNFDLEALNNENRLTWATSSTGSSAVRLIKKTPSIGSTLSTPVTSSPFADQNIDCGTEYCYQLEMDYPDGGQSFSLEKCVVAISTDTPDPVADISTVVKDAGVTLVWKQPNGFTPDVFSIFKSVSDDFGLLDTTVSYQYPDPQYTTESGSCYKISYIDVCGNKSLQSVAACPLVLNGSVQSNNNITLSWSPYEAYKNGVDHYTVEKYTVAGTLLQSTDVSGTTYTDDSQDLDIQLYVYVVKAVPKISGFQPSVSNSVEMIKNPNLFYPKAFTPNGDNLNDLFNVYGQYIISFQMDIFNRWGELMFTTTQLDTGWDGNYKGNQMPEGTYTFVAAITDLAGRTFKKSGSVLLLRKK